VKNLKKFSYFAVIFAVIGMVACNKSSDTALNNPPIQKVTAEPAIEKIPIAKLTDKGIELLFLQRDVQECFAKENPGETLVFVEVQDDNKDGKDAGLLYRIYNEKEKVAETSISFVVTLEKGIYYAPTATSLQNAGGVGATITCTTDECASEQYGCWPDGGRCTPCLNGGKCTKTVSSDLTHLTQLVNAVNYASSVYAMY